MSEIVSGTTTDSYADVADLEQDMRPYLEKTYVVHNTGSNALSFRLFGAVQWAQPALAPLTDEKDVAAGEAAAVGIVDFFEKVVVRVKAATAGSQTDFIASFGGTIRR